MRFILFVLFLISYSIVLGQKVVINNEYDLLIGSYLKSKSNFTVSEIIGHDSTGFYVMRNKKTGLFGGLSFYKNSGHINEKARFFIEKYNYDFELVKSFNVQSFINRGDFDYHFMDFRQDRIYVYLSSYNDISSSRKLLVYQLSNETLEPTGKLITLYENFGIKNAKFKGEYYAASTSADQELSFVVVEKDVQNSDKRTFQLLSFDNDYQLLWEKELKISLSEKNVSIWGLRIDNQNQAHLLVNIHNEDNDTFNQFRLYSVLGNGNELKELTLNISDRHISNIQTAIFDENHLVCAGLYSKKGSGSVDGTFYFKINIKNQQIIEETFREFDLDFITIYMDDRKAKKVERREEKGKDAEMPDYRLDELIINNDGSVYLIAEQFDVDVVTYNSYGPYGTNYYTTYYFNYDDIIVVKFSPLGQIDWMSKIPKNQRTSGDEGFYSSYSLVMQNNDLYFIYNDNTDNFDLDDIKKIKNYNPTSSKSATMISHIDPNGNHAKEVLLHGKTIDAIIKPTISHHLSKDEVILYGHKYDRQLFMGVNLKKQ